MRVPARSASRRPGMSLLEVLVALAVFIMSLAALGQLVQFGLDRAVAADQQAVAARLALSKLGEVECGAITMDGDASEFTEQETRPDGSAAWKYEVACQQTDIPNLYDVTVTVSTVNDSYTYTLSQLVFDPLYMSTATPAVDPNAATTTGGMRP